ncbi:MAG: hypothetical protein EBZ48_07895 [Proteobacteria bacterium]|nr:hypothetical protein [Pseudomonadota bacterium]
MLWLLALAFGQNPAYSQPRQEYRIPSPQVQISFPRDHGAHPEYKTEWWYLTGQLVPKGKALFKDPAQFGFQITFFRRGVGTRPSATPWEEQYLAHAAISDISGGRFHFEKRYARGGTPNTSASDTGLEVRNGPWGLTLAKNGLHTAFTVQSKEGAMYQANLRAETVPEPLLHGQSGFSRKGRCPACASMYYSLPRIQLSGEIVQNGKPVEVHGVAWLDHEWMSGAIDENQVGWDWFSLMHQNGQVLMLFQLRNRSGKVDFASGTLRSAETVRDLTAEEIAIDATDFWSSAATQTTYPSSWRVSVPGLQPLIVAPLLGDQELRGAGEQYWEGAISSPGQEWLGYAELTGYKEPITRF